MKTGYPGLKEFFSKPRLLAHRSALSRSLCKKEAWTEAVGVTSNWGADIPLGLQYPVEHCSIPEMAYYPLQLGFTRINIWWSLFVWANLINSFGSILSLPQALWEECLRDLFPGKLCDGESLGNLAGIGGDSSFLPSAVLPEYFCLTLLWCSGGGGRGRGSLLILRNIRQA